MCIVVQQATTIYHEPPSNIHSRFFLNSGVVICFANLRKQKDGWEELYEAPIAESFVTTPVLSFIATSYNPVSNLSLLCGTMFKKVYLCRRNHQTRNYACVISDDNTSGELLTRISGQSPRVGSNGWMDDRSET